ncbi:MAG: 4Fe-4S binding protein [Candidatus Thermoplasmatota archaeon]|nr:4Fe-4S binding protein [Candidatus Thermoplasmatota archaeon]
MILQMKLQFKRTIAQILIFLSANLRPVGVKTGFCYPFFYCNSCPTATSACPLRALEVGVYQYSFRWKLVLFPLLIIGFFGVLSGRAICGWACPIGLLQRATAPVARKVKNIPLINKIGKHPIEPTLRYLKYVILIGLVFLTTFLIGFMFTDICPIGFLTGTIPTLLLRPNEFVANPVFFLPAFIIFLLFLILICIVERGWCRYFCPLGALFAPFNKISILHVARVDEDIFQKECIHCNACSKICPMGIEVTRLNRDLECILCGKCVEVCPKDLIEFKKV